MLQTCYKIQKKNVTVKLQYYILVSGSDSFDCDFDHGFCNWFQRQGDDFDWKLGTKSTNNTGPNGDHTTGGTIYFFDKNTTQFKFNCCTLKMYNT